jgi:uncharacterized protein YjbJ (UPF0337 family)
VRFIFECPLAERRGFIFLNKIEPMFRRIANCGGCHKAGFTLSLFGNSCGGREDLWQCDQRAIFSRISRLLVVGLVFVCERKLTASAHQAPAVARPHFAAVFHCSNPGTLFLNQEEDAMNNDIVEGKWKQLKGKVRESWGKLTDDDVDEIAGKKDHFIGKIQEKYGMNRDDAEKEWKKLSG